MKKIVLFFMLHSLIVFSQPPSKFNTTFGGNGEDIAYSCKQTLEGNYIIAGSSSSNGFGQTDLYLMKMDSMGQMMWDKYIGGFGNEVGRSVIQLSDSGYVVAGYTSSFGAGGYDMYLVRTDKKGIIIWQKTFGGLDWDFGSDLVQAADGNLVVVGNTSSFGHGKKDGYVLKCDLQGNLIWQKFFGGNEDDELKVIINTNDNYLGIAGSTSSFNDIKGDFYFLKVNMNGDTLFTKNFGNQGVSYVNDIVQRANGEYVLVGAETYTDNVHTKSYMCNYSASWSFNWEGDFYASSSDECWVSVTRSKVGTDITSYLRTVPVPGFKMQGNIFSNPNNAIAPTIVNSFGEGEDEFAYEHEATKDGGFICVGSTVSFNSKGKDIYIIKLDSTIISSTSLVGEKEMTLNLAKYLLIYNENSLTIQFDQKMVPSKIELITMDGRVAKQMNSVSNSIEIDTQMYPQSIMILKLYYPDNTCITEKVLIH